MPPPTKLPHTVAESLRFKPHEPSPLVKARTHEKKAEVLRDDDDASPLLLWIGDWPGGQQLTGLMQPSKVGQVIGLHFFNFSSPSPLGTFARRQKNPPGCFDFGGRILFCCGLGKSRWIDIERHQRQEEASQCKNT